tara:strand:- start:1790 stop:2350 length:561 start_codon:yes stop_codon:yes gene_type:complete
MMNESVFVVGVVRSATQITKSSHRRHLFVPKKKKKKKKTQREGKRFRVACRCYISRSLLKPSAMIPTTIRRRAAFETFYFFFVETGEQQKESCFVTKRKETQRQERRPAALREAIKLLFCIHFNFKISIYVFSSTATSIFRERWNVPIHTTELLLLSPLSFFLSFPSLERNRTSSSLSLSLHLNLL